MRTIPIFHILVIRYSHLFITGYILDIVSDAQLFAEHAERSDITVADVRLAIEGKLTNSFTYPPSRDVLNELAEKKNSQPLPTVPEKFGVRMPHERHCLTAVNFEIVPQVILILAYPP